MNLRQLFLNVKPFLQDPISCYHTLLEEQHLNKCPSHQTMREGSLEVKFPTIWTDGKAEGGRVREEKVRRKKTREKSQ
jgi:hypothetical protein